MWENLKIIADLNKKLEQEGIKIPTEISLKKNQGNLEIDLKIIFPLGKPSLSPEEKNTNKMEDLKP